MESAFERVGVVTESDSEPPIHSEVITRYHQDALLHAKAFRQFTRVDALVVLEHQKRASLRGDGFQLVLPLDPFHRDPEVGGQKLENFGEVEVSVGEVGGQRFGVVRCRLDGDEHGEMCIWLNT